MNYEIKYHHSGGHDVTEEFPTEEAARDRAQYVCLVIDERVRVIEL
ncbi:hypothetical protein ABZV77_11460 [Streptomyces sp. NPDC004732]